MSSLSQKRPCKTGQLTRHRLRKDELGVTLWHKKHALIHERILSTEKCVWKRRQCVQCVISFSTMAKRKDLKFREISRFTLKTWKLLTKGSEALETEVLTEREYLDLLSQSETQWWKDTPRGCISKHAHLFAKLQVVAVKIKLVRSKRQPAELIFTALVLFIRLTIVLSL